MERLNDVEIRSFNYLTMKLDFFIIGAQKCGTTALHYMLNEFTDIQMSATKELHFFDNESIDWSKPDYTDLHASFDWVVERAVRGEATPIYCYWPNSLERIYNYNPNARLIMLLRHPVHRAYSQWLMEFQRGNEIAEFKDAISRELKKIQIMNYKDEFHKIYSYIERGFYAKQIKIIKEIFPIDQLMLIKTEDLWNSPKEVLVRVSDFLGVESQSDSGKSLKYISPIINKVADPYSHNKNNNLFSKLTDVYKSDMLDVQISTGINLSRWFDCDYEEPMQRK